MTLAGDVKPLPDWVKRIGNADTQRGEPVGAFRLWPAARPSVSIDRGERFSFSLRVRPTAVDAGQLQLSTTPTEQLGCRLRREENGTGYWLDLEAGPINEAGTRAMVIELRTGSGGPPAVNVQVTVNVLAENIIATQNSLEVPDISLSDPRERPRTIGRVGIRKLVGSFRITALASSLAFIRLEQQTIVEGSNYLVKLITDPSSIPRAGNYTGLVRIDTDDRNKPRIELPIKLTVVDR